VPSARLLDRIFGRTWLEESLASSFTGGGWSSEKTGELLYMPRNRVLILLTAKSGLWI